MDHALPSNNHAGMGVSRADLGLPSDWWKAEGWLMNTPTIKDVKKAKVTVAKKCPEIPRLDRYDMDPGQDFWSKFPAGSLPEKAETGIIVDELEKLVDRCQDIITMTELERAYRSIESLREGAGACQKSQLPPVSCSNAKLTLIYGEEITDSIAVFVKKGYVAGPFDAPPLDGFRVNSLKAVDQGEKIRPVLNVSLPIGGSFNDNVDELGLEKVSMSTARKVSYSIMDAGKNAGLCKFDLVDAYKNVPAKIFDLRLQGFSWLGKYFVENRQIFGAKTAVSNYDRVGKTILLLSLCYADIPWALVHRTLDDVVAVAPEKMEWVDDFSQAYMNVCKTINVPLAQPCPRHE